MRVNEKLSGPRFATLALLLLTTLLLPLLSAGAETGTDNDGPPETVFSLMDGQGLLVTHFCGECEVDDEYISADNKHYRVTEVDAAAKTAKVELLGTMEMPDVSWLSMDNSQPVSAIGKKKTIAMYCTHSDESYKRGDGTASSKNAGGIYDVAGTLAKEFESLGVTVNLSDDTYLPHDAGAYRRSRQTAVTLLKSTPDAIFDIHRDGIPDPDEYAVTVGNTKMSKVRLLVGRGNQNKSANLNFAKQIKAVADKTYPKLVKDIYIGKGSYNQDLSPRSVLLEFGTHTIDKERVLRSTEPMSEVIYKAMYGGVTGSAGASDVSGSSGSSEDQSTTSNKGTGAIGWMVAALIGGLLLFAFLAGGKEGGMSKFKRSISEMTGGLVGKKPPKE